MDPNRPKLEGRQVEENLQAHATQPEAAGRQFDSVEAMIRYDGLQTPVPLSLAERVAASIARLPRPARSWWDRWFPKRPSS